MGDGASRIASPHLTTPRHPTLRHNTEVGATRFHEGQHWFRIRGPHPNLLGEEAPRQNHDNDASLASVASAPSSPSLGAALAWELRSQRPIWGKRAATLQRNTLPNRHVGGQAAPPEGGGVQ